MVHAASTDAYVSPKSDIDCALDRALPDADEILADRRMITLGEEGWKAVHAALDEPPKATPRLARLVRDRSIRD